MIDPTTLDDHAFAVWAAERAGSVLLDVRAGAAADGLEGKALKDAGDAAAQAELDRILTQHRPDDSVLSEEASDDKSRLTARRVWIIDPLDGTREFSEPPRDDWAVHVALWEDGELVAGAVAQPALGETFSTGRPSVVPPRTSDAPPHRRLAQPAAGLRRGPRRRPRRRAGADGQRRREGDERGARHRRRLRPRRRAVPVGQRRPGGRRPRRRPATAAASTARRWSTTRTTPRCRT